LKLPIIIESGTHHIDCLSILKNEKKKKNRPAPEAPAVKLFIKLRRSIKSLFKTPYLKNPFFFLGSVKVPRISSS